MLLNIVTALELQEMAVLIRPSRQRRPYADATNPILRQV
jgi:hypothetical protein